MTVRRALRLVPVPMSGMNMLTLTNEWTEAIAGWEEELRAAGRPGTTRYLRTYHLRRLAHDHGEHEPQQMTHGLLVAWMARHDWSPETRRSYRASLRLFFRWLHATGRSATDISYSLPTIAVPRALPRPCPTEVLLLAKRMAATDLRVRLMLLTLSETGMRRGELARLHTEHLEQDLDGWSLRVVGKGGRVRLIPLTEDLARVLRLLPVGYAFPGQIDGHLSPAYVGKMVSAALGPGYTAHTLRHRFASLCYAVERDLRAVQELLGHASVTTTQIYTAVPADARRRAVLGAVAA